MKDLLEKIEGVTYAQTVLVGLGLAVAYYFLFFDNGGQLAATLEKIRGDIVSKKIIAADTRKSLEEGESFKKQLDVMSARYQQAIKFLPAESDQADLIRKVTQQVRSAGASIVKIEPQEATENKGSYEEFYIDLELQGKFAELTLFMAYLSKIPRIINVKSFEMKNEAEQAEVPILTFTGQIVGYRYTGTP